MGLFGKKEEKNDNLLPELPKLPDLPGAEESAKSAERPEISPLPALPSESDGLDAIKSGVVSTEPSPKRTMELGTASISSMSSMSSMGKEPIFIKLDKFKEASKSFDVVKAKLKDIDYAFVKMRDLKQKEDDELKAWESEIQAVKSKVEAIDNSLFNKIGKY
jgi:hypothetical protein